MSFIIPISASALKAVYFPILPPSFGSGVLTITAKGVVPILVLDPFIQREPFYGGLRFSVRSYDEGPGPVGKFESAIDISYRLNITLPQPHFQSKSVEIETAGGTVTVPIEYLELSQEVVKLGAENDTSTLPDPIIIKDVLPPIHASLTGGGDLPITAQIPGTTGFDEAWVKPSFNPKFLKLVNATTHNQTITWTFTWNKLPLDPGQSPQLINVITTTRRAGSPAPPRYTEITQGYLVNFVVLADEKK